MIITKEQKFWLESDFVKELLNQIPAHVFWKDTKSIYLGCNKVFAHSLGLSSPEEIIGKMDYDLPTTKEESDAFRYDDKQVMESKQPKFNIEECQTLPDGRKTTLLTNKVPLLDKKNNVIGILGIYYDITERKNREQELLSAKENAELASQAKTEFLENMRHDIRTPLSGIIGFAEILKNEITDPKMKEYASNLAISGYALQDLLNEVLEVIKVKSGEIPILKKKFDLKKKLDHIISLNQAKALQKKIKLSLSYDANIPIYLIGDAARIYRVVLELVTNALNFTHKGHVQLKAELAKNNENDVVIKITVSDSGIGIAPDKQQEIYLEFNRLSPSYQGIYSGHGLGLSIAKQLINDLQGEIYVESKLGVGTTFTFIVKLKKPLLNDAIGSEELIPSFNDDKYITTFDFKSLESIGMTEEISSLYKNRILVVEDSEMAEWVITTMLTNMNCIVDLAKTGNEAISLAEQAHYDLIFMDIGLPDINGYEVAKQIRLRESKKIHVPIIALTAHASEENKKLCIDIGMNAVLQKPLIQEKAEDILNSFIPYRRKKLNVNQSFSSHPEMMSLNDLPVFDFDLLKKQYKTQQTAIEIVSLFLNQLPSSLKEIKIAYKKRDWLALRSLVHKFRGGVSYCAAIRLQEACSQFEEAINEGKDKLLNGLYEQLLVQISLTEKTIKKVIAKQAKHK